MKLSELVNMNEEKNDKKPGTYAGVHFDKATQDAIRQYQKENNIPKPVPPEKLHTTVLYSRKHLPNYQPAGKYSTPLKGKPEKFEVWPSRSGDNCLVLKYKCEGLQKRHKELMDKHEAEYDYPEYLTHVTLSYDIGDMDIKDLPPYEGPINAVEEYAEELDMDWANNNT